jgi:DNA-binding Lrp family transcriptional regulator
LRPMLSELEKQIIAAIQGDLTVTQRPYLEIAQQIGVTEEKLLATLRRLRDKGVMRRFGATLRHQKTGFQANAMTAWRVEEARVDQVGAVMATFPEVSHCYRRNPTDNWPYNLYTMIHATDEPRCRAAVKAIAHKAGVSDYILLFSRRELKKTSMQYFSSDEDD